MKPKGPYEPLFERAAEQKPAEPKPAKQEVLSVADVCGRMRRQLQMIGQVVLAGEVTAFKAHPSGHLYFTLKDDREDASVACAMFRREATTAGGSVIENGARIKVRASADIFAPRGALQLIVVKAALAGEGDLAARREALKRKLQAQGLFDPSRKRPLPNDPRVVGVVTSAGGAAFQDIVKVARRRGNVRILLAPAAVQGEGAAYQLRRALERLGQLAEVDVIIIGRGGGSAEDLAAFDDEHLARAIADCPKPVVAAVGHEVDWSIACLVADVRASTPSQAAELVVADANARRERLGEGVRRLVLAMRGQLRHDAAVLARLHARVRAPERAIAIERQRLDELRDRLEISLRTRIREGRRTRDQLERRIEAKHPRTVIAHAKNQLGPLQVRLRAAIVRALEKRRSALQQTAQTLDAISPLAVLGRGYAIALKDGKAVRDADDLANGDSIELRLHRGRVNAKVTK
ncbi:MAG: exodeoxyribonuclease VII large subunit [Polyangiales bacterium]